MSPLLKQGLLTWIRRPEPTHILRRASPMWVIPPMSVGEQRHAVSRIGDASQFRQLHFLFLTLIDTLFRTSPTRRTSDEGNIDSTK